MRLMLVDDSLTVRKRLTDLCNEITTVEVVSTAATASEAVAALYVYRPDVLVLDIHLGAQNAFDLLKVVGPQFPRMVVMLITGGTTEPYRAMASACGARYLFDKALDMSRLQETLIELSATREEDGSAH